MVDIKKIWDIFLNPVNLRRDVRDHLQRYFIKYLKNNMVVYDIGCGDKPFEPFLKNRVKEHLGVDIEVVWNIIQNSLPALKIAIEALLRELEENENTTNDNDNN